MHIGHRRKAINWSEYNADLVNRGLNFAQLLSEFKPKYRMELYQCTT